MAQGFYGSYLGNAGALNDLVYRGEPIGIETLPYLGDAVNLDPLIARDPSFQIGPRSPFKGMTQEELNKLKEWDQDPHGLQRYYERLNLPGPKLPFAYNPNSGPVPMGNAGFFAGPQMGQMPAGFQNKFVS